jgi:RNA polymerase sigma factor (sigma-70 family)
MASALSSLDGSSTDHGDRGEQPAAGDAAFTAVFREHHRACLRLARRLVRDEWVAHDVVQDVFLAWWRSDGGGYRADRGELANWLSTVTHHKAVDALRTSERHRRIAAAVMSALPHRQERLVDEVVWWELGTQSLIAALPTLTPKQREVLGLAYVHGLTQAEIADRLGIPLGTVKSRTHAGMLRLRAAVSGTWTPSEPVTDPEGHPASSSEPLARLCPQAASQRGPGADTMGQDVERCATALVGIAAEGTEDAPASAAVIGRAAALIDKHGEQGMYALVLALARAAANGAAPVSSPASNTALGRRLRCPG